MEVLKILLTLFNCLKSEGFFFILNMLDVPPNKPVHAEDGNIVIYFNLHLRLKSSFISLIVHPLNQ